MTLPEHGLAAEEVRARLESLRADDVAWREGRAFTLAYHAGDEVAAVAYEALARFSGDNALNTDAFPSLRVLQDDVFAVVGGWLHAPPGAAGTFTAGGTESILLAVKGARERGAASGVSDPEVVLPTSAHAAFEKAAHYFGVRNVRVPVGPDWRADPEAMATAVTPRTVLVVASAPQYPQGVVDPVPAIAAVAAERDVNCHVDACMGGVTLPYLEQLGMAPAGGPWDFRVEGVTSMSVDLHKFAYTAKGASVLLFRDRAQRRHASFVTDNWLGGTYGSPGLLGTRSAGPLAAAWAVLHHVGDLGYRELTRVAREATVALADGIEAIDGLALRARPDTTLLAYGAPTGASPSGASPTGGSLGARPVDVFALADELWRRRWYVDRQGPPPSLHCTVNAVHAGRIAAFLADLAEAVAEVQASPVTGRPGAYSTLD